MTASHPVPAENRPASPSALSAPRWAKGKEVSRKQLINALNHVNFQEGTVSLIFHGPQPDGPACLEAYPMPVLSDYPVIRFLAPLPTGLDAYALTHLVIPDGTGHILVTPQLLAASAKGVSLVLPETGRRILGPPRDSLTASDIRVHFQIKGVVLKARLVLLEPGSLQIRLSPLSAHYFLGLPSEERSRLTFLKGETPLFETTARLLGQEQDDEGVTLHFQPAESIPTRHDDQLYGKKAFPMVPAPDIVFTHPLTGTMQTIVIDSLSAMGLTVTLHEEEVPLLAGMTLSNATISLSDLYTLPVSTHVTRCNTTTNDKGEKITQCHLDFLDMELATHRKIQTMVHKAEDRNMRLSTPVEKDDLWRFFFETGFIYKTKYRLFLDNKNSIKQTYQNLYSAPTEVTRHVTYNNKGRTLGHMSIVRHAERAWLIHHHAALKGGSVKVGLGILRHMIHYCYDCFWHEAIGMDYLMCYFRTDNDFPNFFFNGFAQKIANPKACSVDLFAYLYFRSDINKLTSLPCGWTLDPATEGDLSDLETSYQVTSGGLLLEALDLYERKAPAQALTDRFRKAGLKKERHVWSLRHNNKNAAIVIVNTSDVALNMSELTNCIKVCITRPEEVTKDVLTLALHHLAGAFETKKTPVLIHPLSWVEDTEFHFQKHYICWTLNTKFADDYVRYFSDFAALSTQPR